MFSRFVSCLCLIWCLTVTALIACPENGLGTISGKLMGDLRPVAAAEVVLMQKDKVVDKTKTDEYGNYNFPYVRPGDYDVKATKTGYRTSIIIKIPVSEDHITKNDFYLPKFNNEHMLSNPLVDDYENNCRTYMRQR